MIGATFRTVSVAAALSLAPWLSVIVAVAAKLPSGWPGGLLA
jgi:hypothetical protein